MTDADESSNTSSSPALNCSITNQSSSGPLSEPWYIAAGVVIAVSFLLGIPANITVIVKFSQHLRGSSMSQRLFFNLALSDLLCLLCLPFGVAIFFSETHLTDGVCRLLFYFFLFCITSNLNIVVLIGIQRYYQILHPEKWAKVHRTWQRLLLFSVWMLGALMALPAALTKMTTKDKQKNCYDCSNQRIAPGLEMVYISYAICSYVVLFSFYLLLVKGVKRNQMPDMKKPRATKLFIRIIAVFLLAGFFPLMVRMFNVAASFKGSDKLLRVSTILTSVECFYFFSHCLNPFLYFFASQHHRRKNIESGTEKSHLLNDCS